MKRVLLIGFMLMLVFSMAVFAGGQQEAEGEAGQYPDHPQNEPMKAAVDMGYVPFAFQDEDGEVQGFAVDLADALAEELGRPGAEIVDVEWSGIFSALFTRKVEYIVAPTNITEDRAKEMDFTEPYMNTALLVVAHSDNAGQYEDLEDLEGKVIGANTGSVAHKWLIDNQDEYGYKIDEYDRMPSAAQAVQVNRIDAVADDRDAIGYYIQDKDDLAKALLIQTGEQYGLPMRKGDEYRAELEQALENIKSDGTLAEIYKKWFSDEPEPDSPVVNPIPGIGVPDMPGYIEE